MNLNGKDIIVGTAAAGRKHADLQPIIGMFVNTLALRNYPYGEKIITNFIREVGDRTLEAFENQDYPFEDLVDKLFIQRDAGRNPLFDMMFVLQNMADSEIKLPGLKQIPGEMENKVARFDMTWLGVENEDELLFTCEYCTKLFSETTVRRFAGYYKNALSFVLEKPLARLNDVEFISEDEKYHLLVEFNRTGTKYPWDKMIHELFDEQVSRTPDRIAVETLRATSLQITYRQLNEKSGQLALQLSQKGVTADSIAAIMPERSVEMIIGILGILKSGGAYLPVDPEYPKKRIDYMLKDSGAVILLTDFEKEKMDNCQLSIVNYRLSMSESPHHELHQSSLISSHQSNPLAYIIYTSGSTGNPKGVMVEHRNVVRLVKNTNFVQFRENERLLQTGALEFDASTFEIWGSLLNGIRLFITAKEEILNPVKLKENIGKYDIATMWLTSPLFNQLSGMDVEIFAGLRNLLVGGDVLSPFHINKVKERFPRLNIINGYGPTENTTFSTTFKIDNVYHQRIPIGKPIANSTAYIVDKFDHLVPVGVSGELWVGGDGVSRGYLNNPELTVDRFKRNVISQWSFVNGKFQTDNNPLN
ncbi:MAG: AMP-binding protein, partial [Acidobacteria bacterium]|nr:AMP-binding protein [Acidobacteriota bacterium]